MSTLNSQQVVFVLKSIGKYWMHASAEGLPGQTFVESFIQEATSSAVGRLAIKLAQQYDLTYSSNGEIVLNRAPNLPELRAQTQQVGMRIPNAYRDTAAQAMTYLEQYGNLYLPFNASQMAAKQRSTDVFMHMTTGNDAYLNIYLETYLRDNYTDFDLFNAYAALLTEPYLFNNRAEIITHIMKHYRPAGYFWVNFGFSSIRLTHNYQDRTVTYTGPDAIMAIIFDGVLYMNGEVVPNMGLYQLAFAMKPSYVQWIYGVEISEVLMQQLNVIYQYIINQIKMAEQQGQPKIRFSDQMRELNADLA